MATSSREARRRRIADRGSDRLSFPNPALFIIFALSISSFKSFATSIHCKVYILRHALDVTVSYNGEDKSSSSLLLKVASANESGTIDRGSKEQPFLRKCETNTEALRVLPWEVDGRVESSRVSSTVQNTSISTSDSDHHVEPHVYRSKFFTPNQISCAIAVSESTRIYCSLPAAILVVLSHVGLPVLGSHIVKSTIFFGPLYLVLLTNVSIVLAQLLLGKQRRLERIEQEANSVPLIGGRLQAHAAVVKLGYGFDMMLSNDLIDMYGKCSRMDIACAVFDRMLERNVVSWTALMCGHLQQGNPKVSLQLFCQMGYSDVDPNEFTFSTNFKACGFLSIIENGMQIHGNCVRTGFEWYPVVGNSIVDMYSRCGRISEAERMFDLMPVRSLISWNVMIAGYALEGMGDKALLLFQKMQEQGEVPDEFTLTSSLKACSGIGAIREGSQIHAYLIAKGFPLSVQTIIAGALVDLYVKSGHLFEAQQVFDQVERKSVISWTAPNCGESSIRVDGFVLSSMIGVFADFVLVEQGKQMHCYTIKVPSGLDISVANSIVDMYLKCGLIEEAESHFSEMPERNVVSWTVMITGYGKHGHGREAIQLFKKMRLDNVEPDGVTYLAVLSACSHSGLIEESQEFFSRLYEDCRIKPRVEHYACMVDLLGRAGRLKDAKRLTENMPLKPNVGIWQTLLSACRVHGELEIGREVGELLFRLDGNNPVNYVLMSNIYADAGYWKERESVRELVKLKGLKKEAGQSWVEIDKEVHFFYNGDETHLLTEEIHEVLKEMKRRIKEETGYAYEMRFALHDVEEESKVESLRFHSEKLAIGLALVHSGIQKGGRMIRVFKNLRVCGDCHEFIKGLSRILDKVFLVRDANRFHKFEDGFCSCRDYCFADGYRPMLNPQVWTFVVDGSRTAAKCRAGAAWVCHNEEQVNVQQEVTIHYLPSPLVAEAKACVDAPQ
ncbi:unnamed protein product [Camellia sinensis]